MDPQDKDTPQPEKQKPARGRSRGRPKGSKNKTKVKDTPDPDPEASPTASTSSDISGANNLGSLKRQKTVTNQEEEMDCCPVCLDPPVHTILLECKHSYCFLCAKGLAESGNPTCSLCRMPIKPGYFSGPELIKRKSLINFQSDPNAILPQPDAMAWYYEGRNGWWRFEERHSADIEAAYLQGLPHLELLICGQLYFINLMGLIQFRKDTPGRVRKIKRDFLMAPSIGTAGLVSDG